MAKNFFRPLTTCAITSLLDFVFQDIGTYFRDGLIGTLEKPQLKNLLHANGDMGFHGLPKIPIYAYKAIGDEISVVGDTDALVNKYCSMGIKSLVYVRDAVGEHLSEGFTGAGGALGYLTDRFNGIPAPIGCSTQDVVISSFDLSALGGFAAEVQGNVEELFMLPIGPASLAGP